MVYIMDGLSGIADFVEVYQSLIWNVQYFGKSDFQLICVGDNENIEKLKVGRYLVREEDVKGGGRFENVMVIENQKIEYDADGGWMLTVSGSGLKTILSRRIVWKQTTMSGSIETAVRQIVLDNAISPEDEKRKIPDLRLDEEKGYTEEIDVQLLGENVADWIMSIAQSYGYGWDVYIDNGYVFTFYKGADRTYNQSENIPVVFSEENDNLIQSTYAHSMANYGNSALIGGEGEGIEKRTATIGDAEGLDRYEKYVDGSSVSSNGAIITLEQYMALLEDYGREQLADVLTGETFSGEIEPDGVFTINRDYFLGDLVQIVTEKGIKATPRIIEIIYAEDSNGFSVVPTFSEWEV